MRFHIVGMPHTCFTDAYSACAFSEKGRKLAIMLKARGHTVFLYGGETNEAPCDEHIACISEADRAAHVGDKHYIFASFDYSLPVWRNFNARAAAEIAKRAEPHDFICSFAGLAHKQIADTLPHMLFVEAGIGYGGTFAPYRVWESNAWRHLCYGAAAPHGNPNAVDGRWFDAVIPGYFEVERFPFKNDLIPDLDPYYFFIGRLTQRKGYQIAIDVCRDIGKKLVVAGQKDAGVVLPPDVQYVGVIGPKDRGILMARAKATFVPTIYVEPFGNVAVESQGCGTPVLTTDWGAFTETVIDGVTGFRCHTFGEFKRAALAAPTLDPHKIRQHAIDNYSLEVIGEKYERYFERLTHLWSDGWYEGRTLDVSSSVV